MAVKIEVDDIVGEESTGIPQAGSPHLQALKILTGPGGDRISMSPERIREGLDFGIFDAAREAIGAPAKELADFLSISESTVRRRRRSGQFTSAESDRLVRLLEILALAQEAFGGDRDRVHAWMTNPHARLGEETPLEHIDTLPGTEEVKDLLYAIRYHFAA